MYNNIDEIIAAVTKKSAINDTTQAQWREEVTRVYAGHFFVVKDKTQLSEGGGKYHLMYIDKRGNYEHVFDRYDKDTVHMVAQWFETTGPFTSVQVQIVQQNRRLNGSRSYFSDANMGTRTHPGFNTKVFDDLYAGRFFITRDRNRLSNGHVYTYYRILATDNDASEVTVLTPLNDCFDDLARAKRWIKKLTQWATKPRPVDDLGEPGNINALIASTQEAIALAKKLGE